MNITFITGIVGSLVLVAGAGWPPERVKHPVFSVKNWLFAAGGAVMLAYAILNYLAGGPIFFVFLEVMVAVANILMMLNTDDRVDVPILAASGLFFVVWSLKLFDSYGILIFIVGLSLLAIGYALDTGSFRRTLALTLGSLLMAIFSYISASWIFFWLNVFFTIFSGYYALLLAMKKHG